MQELSTKLMAKKKSFVLRLNPNTYKAIEKWAGDEFRSVNGQLEWMIDRMLKEEKRLGLNEGKVENKNKEDKD